MRAPPPFPLVARARGAVEIAERLERESRETLDPTSRSPPTALHCTASHRGARLAASADTRHPPVSTRGLSPVTRHPAGRAALSPAESLALILAGSHRSGRCHPLSLPPSLSLSLSLPLCLSLPPWKFSPVRGVNGPEPRMDIVSTLGLSNFVVQFSRISLYPFFDMAHYTLSIMNLKNQPGAIDVAHDSPIACWFSGMLCCFGGAILASLLLGEPPIEPFTNSRNIILASVIWYLIFYCPYDKFYKCCNFLPSKLFIAGMKEVTRARKIVAGVVDAHSRYRNGWLAVIAVGWAKGAGSGLISNFEQLVRGVWMPERNELLKMSYATKVTLIGAVLFTMQEMNHLPITRHNLIFLYTMFVVSTKVAMVLFNIHHSPFAPMEIALYHMAFSWQSSSSEDHFKTEDSNKEELQGKQCPAPSGIPSEEMEKIKRRKTKKSE